MQTNEFHVSRNLRIIEAPAAYVKQRINEMIACNSYAGIAQAKIMVLTEALLRTTELLYQTDIDDVYSNIDRYTYKVLRPLPWGSIGWKQWGMRELEATVLRRMLMDRSGRTVPRKALYIYVKEELHWYLNVVCYKSYEAALDFLQMEPISLQKWRDYAGTVRQANLDRVNKGREKVHAASQ